MAKAKAKEAPRAVRVVDVEDYLNEPEPTNDTAPASDTAPTVEQTPDESESEVVPTGIYALIKYDVTKADIRERGKAYSALTFDTPTNYEQGRRAIAILRETRGGIEARRVDLKRDSLEFGRRVDSTAKELTGLILDIEEPLKAKKKAADDEKARVKAEKEEAERREIEEKLRAEREAEEARLKAEREAEETRLRVEREAEEERLRAIRAAEEEQLRAERAKLDEERARLDAERKAADAAREAEQSRIAAERAAMEAERRALTEAREKAERAEFERLAKIRAEEEAQAKAERDRVAAEEAKIAEAERQAEHARRMAALKPDVEKLKDFAQQLRALPTPALATDDGKDALEQGWRLVLQGLAKFEAFGN